MTWKSVSIGWQVRTRLVAYSAEHRVPMTALLEIAVRKLVGSVDRTRELPTVGRPHRPQPTGAAGRDTVAVREDTHAVLVRHAGELSVTIAALAKHVLIELMRHPLSDADVEEHIRARRRGASDSGDTTPDGASPEENPPP
jgi:hypothetical protein